VRIKITIKAIWHNVYFELTMHLRYKSLFFEQVIIVTCKKLKINEVKC